MTVRAILLAAVLGVLPATAGCLVVPPARSAGTPSAQAADDDDDSAESPDDEAGVYGDHIDDETGVYMGPDCEPTGPSEDDPPDNPE